MAAGVFISFRPENFAWAARIRDRLQSGAAPSDLGRGADFASALNTRAREVKAVVLIIGKNWLAGMRDDPNDPARIEIEAALSLRIRMIPLLVDGASMPEAGALPESLKVLAHLRAIELSAGRFDSDIERLEQAMRDLPVSLSGKPSMKLPFPDPSELRLTRGHRIAPSSPKRSARKSLGKKTTAKKAAAKKIARKSGVNTTARKGAAKRVAMKQTAGKKTAAKKAMRPTPEKRYATRARPRIAANQDLSVGEMKHLAFARRGEASPVADRPRARSGNPPFAPKKFRPLRDRVVIRRIEGEEKTKGGIIIPDTAKEKPQEGEIIAVGSGARDESGKLVPLDVRTGRQVVFDSVEEIVECSVFGPSAAPPGETILIQAFLHLANQAERASFLARTMDASAQPKATKSLDLPIKRGARVEIAFSANGLLVDDPVQSVVWRGEPAYCQFLATIPAGTSGQSFFAVTRLSVDGKLTGSIKFRLSSDTAAPHPISEPIGDHAKLYQYAFVSYASKDREEVLKRVQMLEVLKTKFFQDILSLDPGDRWEKKLYENIDRCDLFLLFWSQAAKDSQWVIKEAEYALAHQQKNPGSEPDLVPVVLEQNVLPPSNLSAFHFNDRISYLISRKP